MSPKKPETPVRIDSEVTFREKVGLSGSPVSLEWKKDQVLETTEGALTKLRDELSGKTSADEKKAVAEAFLRSQEQTEAEGDLGDQLTAALGDGLKDKLIKSGVVVGAVAAGTALIQGVDSQLSESTGMKLKIWDRFQAWAAKEYKTTDNALIKWLLGFFVKDNDKVGAESGAKPENADARQDAEKFLSAKSYDITTKILIYGVAREKFDTALGAALKGVKDATWGLDEVKKREEVMSQAIIILSMSDIKKLSWSQISSLGEAGLLKIAEKDSPQNQAAVSLIFTMLGKHQAERLAKVFAPEDWKQIPLGKLMSKLYEREGHGKIEEITDRLKDIDITKVKEMPTSIFVSIATDSDGKSRFEGLLQSDFDSLKSQGIGVSFISKIISLTSGTQNIGNFKAFIGKESLSSQEKVFIEKVMDTKTFLDPVRASLKERFGFTDGLMSLLGPETLSMKDLTEIYLLTGGVTDVSQMNKGRRALLFTKLQMMFMSSNPAAFGEYMRILLKEGAEKYPDALEVGTMVDSVLNYSVYKATFTSISGGEKFLTGLLSTLGIKIDSRTGLALGMIGGLGGLIWLAIQLSPVGRIASIVTLLAGSLGLAGFTVAQASPKK